MANKLTKKQRKEILTMVLDKFHVEYRTPDRGLTWRGKSGDEYLTEKQFNQLYPKKPKPLITTPNETKELLSTALYYQTQYPGKSHKEIMQQIKDDYKVHGNLPDTFTKSMYKVIKQILKSPNYGN